MKTIAQLYKAANQNLIALSIQEMGEPILTGAAAQIEKAVKLTSQKKAKPLDFTQEELIQIGQIYVNEWLVAKYQERRLSQRKKLNEAEKLMLEEWGLVFHNADKVISKYTEGQRVRAAAAYRKVLNAEPTSIEVN